MRILLLGLNFWPEPIGIAKYSGEMAFWLAERGHEVRVVTTPPYYPQWKTASGEGGLRYRRQQKDGVDIWRCPLWVPNRATGLKRVIHLTSFAAGSLPAMALQLFWRPDVVMTVEPAFSGTPLALLTARLCGAKAWLHVQDFELDAAFELGMLPSGHIKNFVLRAERWLMRRFDKVSTISESMIGHLAQKGVPNDRRIRLPNWVDTKSIRPMDSPSPVRNELRIPSSHIVCLYSGNMGEKQGLEVLVACAKKLADSPEIHFVLCGQGSARARLEAAAAKCPNIQMLDLQPAERLNDLLNAADIHLLPQRPGTGNLVFPSKLTGMLASGRPVVAIAEKDTQVGRVLANGPGILTPWGDVDFMVEAIRSLAKDQNRRLKMGRQARDYAMKNLDRDKILENMVKEMAALFP